MPRFRPLLVVLAAGAAALAFARPVMAANLDHLVCYRAVDPLSVSAAFDLFAELQPEFSAKGCRIVKVSDFCVPASKLNVTPASAAPRADVAGPPLQVDYVGYLVRCAEQRTPPNKVVVDQFGTHRQGKYKLQKIYVPAKKGAPPCGTVDGKACGGVCPSSTDECRVDDDGACRCVPPVDNLCGGKPDAQGTCGGPCPDPAMPTCQVTVSTTGQKVCACGPPPPPLCSINAATGTCGGECPNKAEKCLYTAANECRCVPASTPCALVPGTVPTCGGDCPVAGDVCSLDATTGSCVCGGSGPAPCDRNPFTGTCGGDCPVDLKCLLDSSGACSCQPPPCGSDATGVCGGSCPDPLSQQCKVDASGACNCSPSSCGLTGVDTCGGICPTGLECLPSPNGTAPGCRCQ